VAKACAIEETFLDLWNYVYEGQAHKFFDRSNWWATHSRLKAAIKVAKMTKRQIDNILAYCCIKIPIPQPRASTPRYKR
jgi:hypothetical protein